MSFGFLKLRGGNAFLPIFYIVNQIAIENTALSKFIIIGISMNSGIIAIPRFKEEKV